MTKSWPTMKLGEVCDVIGGGTPSKSNVSFYGGEILWATVRDMRSDVIEDTEQKITQKAVDSSSTNIIPKGNVVIATRVGLGKVCLLAHDTAINQDLKGVVPKNPKQLDVEFLYWWFRSISSVIVNEGTGVTVQGVKLSFIKDLDIPVPPPQEQRRTVEILAAIFSSAEKIKENTEQKLRNLEELKASALNVAFPTTQ